MPFDSEQQTPTTPNFDPFTAPAEQVGTPVTAPEVGKTPEKRDKKSRKALYGTVGVVAGAAIVAGAIVGVTSQNEKPDKRVSESSASADPSRTPEATPSPTPTPEVLTVQSVEIPAGLMPEKLGETFISRLSDWDMAGTTAANRDAWLNAADSDTYAKQLAETNGAIYAEALYGADWQSNAGLAVYVPNKIKANDDIVQLWFSTSAGADARDLQPYKNWDTVESVTVLSQTGNSVTERISVTANNNSNENRADQLAPGTAALNGEQFDVLATFTTVGGIEKVSSFNIVKPS